MTAQAEPSIFHARGMKGRAKTIIITIVRKEIKIDNQNRLKIFGTSLKKLENSTSFFVAAHVMLYENRWASTAPVKCRLSPPKKKLDVDAMPKVW
jgi:hypothetical protein